MKYDNMSLGIIGSIKGKVLISDGKVTKKINASASSNNVRLNKNEMIQKLILDAIAKFNYSMNVNFEGSNTLRQQLRNNQIKYAILEYRFDYSDVDKFYNIKRVTRKVKGKNRYYIIVRDKKTGKIRDFKKWNNKLEGLEL